MALTLPSPPGYAAGSDDQPPARLQAPSPANVHIIGTFERGTVGQLAAFGDVPLTIGARTNNTAAVDVVNTLLALRVPTINYSRVVGQAAVRASRDIGTSLRIRAKSAGAWANNVTVEIVDVAGARRILIRESGVLKATSATFADNTAAVAFTDAQALVEVIVLGSTLAPVIADGNLTGGDADLAGITPARYADAAAALDRRYGPGLLLLPGVTSLAVQTAVLAQLEPNNRIAKFELDAAVTEGDGIARSQALEAAAPDVAWRWELYDGPTAVLPIGSQPERSVSWATVQAGIQSRVFQDLGVGPAPFGELRGQGRPVVQRLLRQRTSLPYPGGEVQRLYAERVNVPVDRGSTINLEGLRTGSKNDLLSDGAVAFVRMVLLWRGESLARRRIGDYVDRNTVVDYGSDLVALCKEFVEARAINDDSDAGFAVDIDSVNTQATMQRRELHGVIRYRPTPSADWVDLLVGASRAQEAL